MDRDKELASLRKALLTQEAENREFFERLGISPLELLQLFQEEGRFPKEIWNKLQAERRRIEERLDHKIQACAQHPKKEAPNHLSEIKSHWIFLR